MPQWPLVDQVESLGDGAETVEGPVAQWSQHVPLDHQDGGLDLGLVPRLGYAGQNDGGAGVDGDVEVALVDGWLVAAGMTED